jgi:hypothetical protein
MVIPSYQIHNVLKVYSKQLSQTRIIERQKALAEAPSVDKINISAEGKRQTIIEKVANDIVDRITQFGPQDEVEHEIVNQLQDEIGQPVEFMNMQNKQFVFNTIDDQNMKKTGTLMIEDSTMLIRRLEQIAKDAVDKNMEA